MDFKPEDKFDRKQRAKEKAYKNLEEALAKLKMNQEKIRLENERQADPSQVEINTDLALDILREDIKKIINDLASNI